MDYQAICAALEVPIAAKFAALAPNAKLYFDNILAVPPDAPGEYVHVNIVFARTTESALDSSLNYARGVVVFRLYAQKDAGGLRARQLAGVAKSVLDDLACTKKTASGVFLRTQNVIGPSFSMNNESPHFMARIEAGWQATNIA